MTSVIIQFKRYKLNSIVYYMCKEKLVLLSYLLIVFYVFVDARSIGSGILTGMSTTFNMNDSKQGKTTSSNFLQYNDNNYLVSSFNELNNAIAQVKPGDTILMHDGLWKDVNIVFKAKGTEKNPVVLKAHTPGKVIISGLSSLSIQGEYLVVDGLVFKDGYSPKKLHLIEMRSSHSRLANCAIIKYNKPRSKGSDVWVGLFGTHNRIDHCFFDGKTSESVMIIAWRYTPTPDFHQIDHNHFMNVPVLGRGGATVIRIGDGVQALSASKTVIEANLFENMEGIGKIVSLKSGGNIIRNNTFNKAAGSICIRMGNENIIEGNFIYSGTRNKHTGGILVIGSDHIIRNNYIQGSRFEGKAAITLYEGEPNNHPGKGGYYPTKNVLIEGNTLVDNDKNIVIGQYYDPEKELTIPVENIKYKDNLIVGNNQIIPLIVNIDPPIGKVEYQNNFFFGGKMEKLEEIEGIRNANPHLIKKEDGRWYYKENSSLKRNIKYFPLTAKDVGPDWMK